MVSLKDLEADALRRRLEDNDAMRDAQRRMAWFALIGMLLYPFGIFVCHLCGFPEAALTLADIAPTYFVAVAAIVAAFYGKEAIMSKL
jgi:uncharacterized membrane protein